MSAWWAIVVRELRMRASIPVVALAVGVVSALMGQQVIPAPFQVTDYAFVPLTATIVFALVVALLVGWTALGDDLSAGRLSFYFSRPVAWWAVWGGKFVACLILTGGAAILSMLPWIASGFVTPIARGPVADVSGWLALAGVTVFALALAASANVIRHASSAVRATHLVLVTATVMVALAMQDSVRYGLWALLGRGRDGVASWPLAVALIAGAIAQVRSGRADVRRGHWPLVVVTWSLLAVTLSVVLGVGTTAAHGSPRWLSGITWAARPAYGDWIVVSGSMFWSQYETAFLMNPPAQRTVALGPGDREIPVGVTPNGRRAVLLKHEVFLDPGRQDVPEIRLIDLVDGVPVTSTIPYFTFGVVPPIATDDGCFFAFSPPRQPTWQCEGSREYHHPFLGSERWLSWSGLAQDRSGTIRALVRDLERSRVHIVELAAGQARRQTFLELHARDGCAEIDGLRTCSPITGSFPAGSGDSVHYDAFGMRVLVFHQRQAWVKDGDRDHVDLNDGITGALLARLPGKPVQPAALFTPDGQLAWVEIREGQAVARMFTAAGEEGPTVSLGSATRVDWVGRATSDFAFVRLIGPAGAAIVRIDWRSLGIVAEPGLQAVPVGPDDQDVLSRRAEGSPATDLFVDESGALVDVDPVTRTRTVLFRPLAARLRGGGKEQATRVPQAVARDR